MTQSRPFASSLCVPNSCRLVMRAAKAAFAASAALQTCGHQACATKARRPSETGTLPPRPSALELPAMLCQTPRRYAGRRSRSAASFPQLDRSRPTVLSASRCRCPGAPGSCRSRQNRGHCTRDRFRRGRRDRRRSAARKARDAQHRPSGRSLAHVPLAIQGAVAWPDWRSVLAARAAPPQTKPR